MRTGAVAEFQVHSRFTFLPSHNLAAQIHTAGECHKYVNHASTQLPQDGNCETGAFRETKNNSV